MRDYLTRLANDQQLIEIDKPVDPCYELAAVTRALQRHDKRAVRFNRVAGSELPVVTNVHIDRDRFAALIGAERRSFCRSWPPIMAALDEAAFEPTTPGPRPAELVEGRLSDLPLITYHARDAAPYITAGIVLVNDPEIDTPNLSFHRSMYVSDDELRIRIGESHDLAAAYAQAEARDEALDAAILIGVEPPLFMAATAWLPREASELALAAAIDGRSLATFPGATIDLEIPAGVEIVIEGRILPHERRREAPFGEFLGYYVPERTSPVFEVTSVYWRPGAVFHSLLCGSAEDRVPLQMLNAAKTYAQLSPKLPGIVDVSCAPSLLNTTICIDQQYDGHARDVLMAAFEVDRDYHKLCVVVDADDDPDDITEVFRAMISRGRLDKRVTIIENMPGFYRDPHGDHLGRLGIDATRPFGREAEFEKKTVPGEDDVNLDDYL